MFAVQKIVGTLAALGIVSVVFAAGLELAFGIGNRVARYFGCSGLALLGLALVLGVSYLTYLLWMPS